MCYYCTEVIDSINAHCIQSDPRCSFLSIGRMQTWAIWGTTGCAVRTGAGPGGNPVPGSQAFACSERGEAVKVTVCELRNDCGDLLDDWSALVAHTRQRQSDLVLLPEMPFAPWPAGTLPDEARRQQTWQEIAGDHTAWLSRLQELAPATVVSTLPVIRGTARLNEGFVWTPSQGLRMAHVKVYLPEEEGFWEASWYDRGPKDFHVIDVEGVRIGFLICTELWFNDHARVYATEGIHLLVTPRSTYLSSLEKWVAGGRTAAVVAGAYGLSSNRGGVDADGTVWGGGGWVVDPEGTVLGMTDQDSPFLTVDISLATAEASKLTYPRYVEA